MDNPNKLFPLIVTDKLDETRAFYKDTLNWEIAIDMDAYLQVRSAGEDGPELAFMAPDGVHPSYKGEGVILSVPTQSADELHDDLAKKSVELLGAPKDQPWGWRSFAARDPSGVLLDFFHVTGPNPMLGDSSK